MILTCPECATSYFVDDGRIPVEGRRVRCSSCGHRWTATPDGQVADAGDGGIPDAEAAPPPDAYVPAEDVSPPVEPELAPVDAPLLAPPLRPARARGRARPPKRTAAFGWAGAAALAVALIAGAIVFREQVVRFWPASSAAYAGVGLGVGGGGLLLEQVRAQPAFLAGRPVLSVTGAIRNPRGDAIEAPPVRVTLFNGAGQPLAAKIARAADASIPAGARRHFAITLIDPPAAARDLEVRFETAGGHGKAAHAAEAVRTPAPAPLKPPAHPPAEAAPHAPAPHSPTAATEHG